IRLSPAAPTFKAYADYSFFDPSGAKKSFAENLEDAKTDAEGAASFDMPLERFAEGTYRLELRPRASRRREGAASRPRRSRSSLRGRISWASRPTAGCATSRAAARAP